MEVRCVPAAFFFSTGQPDGLMATSSHPQDVLAGHSLETESADDFVLTAPTSLTSATFTGLLTGGTTIANVGQVGVEIYQVFPQDSDVARTSGAPTFSTPQVPTRVNSPSDVALFDSKAIPGSLIPTAQDLGPFLVLNSVQEGGIHPSPDQTTGGNGPVSGEAVQFTVTFTTPLTLPAGHYFFVPQVLVNGGDFLWLSAPRPITVPPGTPFPSNSTDLQEWTRDSNLDPDWLRVGQDIVGGAARFNASFSLTGVAPGELTSLAFTPFGEVGTAVSPDGTLSLVTPTTSMPVTSNVGAASLASNGSSVVLDVVSLDGVLTQVDQTGSHILASNISTASVTLTAFGPVTTAVSQDGTVSVFVGDTPFPLQGVTNAADASLAFGTNTLVLDVVGRDGTLTLFDQTGPHVLAGNISSASVSFTAIGPVTTAVSLDGTVSVFVGDTQFPLVGLELVQDADLGFSPPNPFNPFAPMQFGLLTLFQDRVLVLFDSSGEHIVGTI